jgi:hypothetical protein
MKKDIFTSTWILVWVLPDAIQESAGKDWLFLGSGIRCRYKMSKKALLIS